MPFMSVPLELPSGLREDSTGHHQGDQRSDYTDRDGEKCAQTLGQSSSEASHTSRQKERKPE